MSSLCCSSEREFTHMSMWIAGIDSERSGYLFYSSLNMISISGLDYAHAQRAWEAFSIKIMGQYHDFYLMTNTLLLANVFEAFKNLCLEIYKLDPAHFYMAPGLALQAALKITGVRLELLMDPSMHQMFEHGIQGGLVQVVHCLTEANNMFMGHKWNPQKPNTYLQYLDANNLYGWAMCQPLPTGGFHWVKDF